MGRGGDTDREHCLGCLGMSLRCQFALAHVHDGILGISWIKSLRLGRAIHISAGDWKNYLVLESLRGGVKNMHGVRLGPRVTKLVIVKVPFHDLHRSCW